jgi:serine/threonine protein phosphatase 1
MDQLPLYLIKDSYFLTHAFALPYFKRRDIAEKKHSFLVNRVKDIEEWGHDFEEGYEQYPLINIFGHEDFGDVFIKDNLYGIDTGCVYGNKLSALELGSMKIYEENVYPLDISKITAVDVVEYFEAYTEKVIHFRLDNESILFDIPLTPQKIDDALQKMPVALKEFFNMFAIDMIRHTSTTSLRLNYVTTLS